MSCQSFSYSARDGQVAVQGAIAKEIFSRHGIQLNSKDNFHCTLLNSSFCPVIEGPENFIVLVYNPLARTKSISVRIPVTQRVKVYNEKMTELSVEYAEITSQVKNLPGRTAKANIEVLFEVEDVYALGKTRENST